MDPNATLKEIRDLISSSSSIADDEDSSRLAELMQALDNWIVNGGFLPEAWRKV